MAKRTPPRPTGTISKRKLLLQRGRSTSLGAVETFKLPHDKVAAETLVMDKSLLAFPLMDLPKQVRSAVPHPLQNGPDFNIVFDDGSTGFVELAELAPLQGPFAKACQLMRAGDFIDHAVNVVRKKQSKYLGRGYAPLILMLYVSDDRFTPSRLTTAAIATVLSVTDSSAFMYVTITLFAPNGDPTVVRLKPNGWRLDLFAMMDAREKIMGIANAENAKLISGGRDANGYVDTTLRFYYPNTTMDLVKEFSRDPVVAHNFDIDLGD